MNRRLLLLSALLPFLLPSCNTSGGAGFDEPDDNGPEVQARNAAILAEPRGEWFVGRRYFTSKCRYWGYVRRPGELWTSARLVVMDESAARTPDRLPEQPVMGNAHGFDHNSEYRIWGRYSGRTAYDPNSDCELPVFTATRYELISSSPGFLFSPRERYSPNYIPARIARAQSSRRL
jgi:hypothetical protein